MKYIRLDNTNYHVANVVKDTYEKIEINVKDADEKLDTISIQADDYESRPLVIDPVLMVDTIEEYVLPYNNQCFDENIGRYGQVIMVIREDTINPIRSVIEFKEGYREEYHIDKENKKNNRVTYMVRRNLRNFDTYESHDYPATRNIHLIGKRQEHNFTEYIYAIHKIRGIGRILKKHENKIEDNFNDMKDLQLFYN